MTRLIRRQHHAGTIVSEAVYSPCETYRYSLTRRRGDGPRILWIMLNPSTADARANDPTIERCERRSWSMGFGSYRIVNLFGFRASDPADLKRADDPVGPSNDRVVLRAARQWLRDESDLILCGWGVHGAHLGRSTALCKKLLRTGRPMSCLGTTQAGHPRHPLYVSYSVGPEDWDLPKVEGRR